MQRDFVWIPAGHRAGEELADILLYAKPLTLNRRALDISELIADGGTLIIEGSSADKVILTSDADTPAAGDWR